MEAQWDTVLGINNINTMNKPNYRTLQDTCMVIVCSSAIHSIAALKHLFLWF